MQRLLALTTVTLAAVSAALVATATTATAAPMDGSRYTALTPQRALDTREQGGPLGPGVVRAVSVAGQGVPATATAVVLNLTATAPTAGGFLTVYPAGVTRPGASSLNKRAGETRSNSVTVALPSDGSRTVDVYNQAGSTQVVVDVLGYYGPTGASSYYSYLTPGRAFDSRTSTDGAAPLAPGEAVTLSFAQPDVTGISAVAVNLTAVDPNGAGFLTAWNGEGEPPFVSSLNYEPGRTTPNFAVVPATQDADGTVSFGVANEIATSGLLVDLIGFYGDYSTNGASAYVPVVPQRLADTRNSAKLGPGGTVDIPVPNGVDYFSANVNLTAVTPTAPTYLTAYADDVDRPGVSTLNPVPGDIVANATQTLLGLDGKFRVFNFQGQVDAVADFEGYFVADLDDATARPARAHALTVPSVTAVRR